MKKLISIILTACICLSLLGGISFAGAETVATEVTYLFSLKDANLTSYPDSTQIHSVESPSPSNWKFNSALVGGETNSGKSFELRTGGYLLCKTSASNDYIALTIDVPVTGKYSLDYYVYQNYGGGQPRGGYGDVYLIQGKLTKSEIEDEINKGDNENRKFTKVQYFSDITNAKTYNYLDNKSTYLTKGEYTLVLTVSEESEKIDTTAQGQTFRIFPSALKLIPVSSKTYTFDKDVVDSNSWNNNYTGNYASTIIPVKDYGTHGYKYFNADKDTYESVVKSVTALQFSGSGYFRLRSYVADLFNNLEGAKLALAFEKPYKSPLFYSVSVTPGSISDNTATAAEFFAEHISETKTTVEEYTRSESNIGGTHSLGSVAGTAYDLGELVYCNGKDDLMISFFTGAAGEDGIGKNMRISSLTLTPVDVSAITLDVEDSLEVGATTSVKVMAGDKSVVDSFVTYTVTEDSDVIDIAADGAITAKSTGSATITATVGDFTAEKTIEVVAPVATEPQPEAAPTEISYGVFDNIARVDAVTVSGGEDNALFGTVPAGTEIEATANDMAGYKFRYWVLGSAATGRYYSSDKTVTINPYANIALTAIYTEAEEETKFLDFFNWNGEFVDSKEVTDGKIAELPTQPSLIGYSFINWILEDNTTTFTDVSVEIPANISRAMAQYNVVGNYDTPVEKKNSATGWTRNGKLVTYSNNYEFFTWLNAVGEIAAYNGEAIADKIPLAVLENSGKNFMLEYDKGDYTIKEAGILFGKTEKVDVASAYSKATAKNIKAHGQLTAAPEGDANMELYARGYVMYGDKVIYTDAIEVIYGN